MKRFSLLSLLLLTAFIGASLAWWLERTKQPEVFYLHVFSWHYRISHDPSYPIRLKHGEELPQPPPGVRTGPSLNPIPVCLLTIAFSPEVPQRVYVAGNYDPMINVEGDLSLRDSRHFNGKLEVELGGPDIATVISNRSPIKLDELVDNPSNENFYVISRSPDPYDLKVIKEKPWNKNAGK
jgi:hypothetical protein